MDGTFEYRADGWPLCPRCGDDELWSAALPASTTGDLSCYRCGWSGSVPLDPLHGAVPYEPNIVNRPGVRFYLDDTEDEHQMVCYCAEGWVCEEHPDKPWPHPGLLGECPGPGMPCENPACVFGRAALERKAIDEAIDRERYP